MGPPGAHFSVSISPVTNQRCMTTTTATGGSMASKAVAMISGQSTSAREKGRGRAGRRPAPLRYWPMVRSKRRSTSLPRRTAASSACWADC